MRDLRILCLHGYHGSARILQSQMAPLASALPGNVELAYVDAPSLAMNEFGWWHSPSRGWDRTLGCAIGSPTYKGTYTGLLKLFLDRFDAGTGLRGLAIPLMLGGSPAHALAPELTTAPDRSRRTSTTSRIRPGRVLIRRGALRRPAPGLPPQRLRPPRRLSRPASLARR